MAVLSRFRANFGKICIFLVKFLQKVLVIKKIVLPLFPDSIINPTDAAGSAN